VKIHFNDETRRISLEKVPTYGELVETLKQLFPTLSGKFTVKYQDEDNDMITISSDKELVEAVNVSANTKLLRLTLSDGSSPAPSNTRAEQPKQTPSPFDSSSIPQQPNLGNIASLLNPQFLAQMMQGVAPNQQQPQAPSSPFFPTSVPRPEVNNNSSQPNQDMPPFMHLLSNPAILQLLPTFLPMIMNAVQNATPQQKERWLGVLQQLASNPQFSQNPQLLPLISQITSMLQAPTNTQQTQQTQHTQSQQNSNQPPFDFAQAFSSANSSAQTSTGTHYPFEEAPSVPNFYCDVCENTISGVRYHCNTCENYDLCSYCQSIPDIHDSSHKLAEIHPPH